jgi:hypothetical protein
MIVTARSPAVNRRYALIISTLFVAFLGALAVVGAYPRFKQIEKRGPAPESVVEILPGDMNTAAASIGTVFNDWSDFARPGRLGKYQNKFPYGSQWSRFFLFRKDDAQNSLFPSDEQILLDRGADIFVERYVRIPPELRTRDFYLYEPSGDYYWESEYFYHGQPAKFRCSFLIHLEPAGKSSVKVQVFEYQPTIWVGEYFGFSAHAVLPTVLHDIRSVEATTTDRKAVLAVIERAESPQSKDSTR